MKDSQVLKRIEEQKKEIEQEPIITPFQNFHQKVIESEGLQYDTVNEKQQNINFETRANNGVICEKVQKSGEISSKNGSNDIVEEPTVEAMIDEKSVEDEENPAQQENSVQEQSQSEENSESESYNDPNRNQCESYVEESSVKSESRNVENSVQSENRSVENSVQSDSQIEEEISRKDSHESDVASDFLEKMRYVNLQNEDKVYNHNNVLLGGTIEEVIMEQPNFKKYSSQMFGNIISLNFRLERCFK